MNVWQVQIKGEGFYRRNTKMSFELSCNVLAESPDHAFKRVVALAKMENPELNQAELEYGVGVPRPVINAEEIVELQNPSHVELEKIEIFWAFE